MKSFILLFSTLFSGFARRAKVSDISAKELLATDTSDWLILDVRSSDEYAMGYISGAINISHLEIESHLPQLLPFKDKPVLLYCRSGRRVADVANILLAHGFSQLKHLEGDMLGWQKDGLAIEK